MKTESTAKYVIRLAATLLIITAVVAVALAGVNSITAPKIAAFKWQKLQNAIEEVLPGGGESMEYITFVQDISDAYQGENGYAVAVTPSGFGGPISMMVGVSNDGEVLGISIVSQTETAGLGAVSAAKTSAGEAFRGQFAGMSGSVAVTKDGGQVDAITGATITSRAICSGVNSALEFVAEQQETAAGQG